MLLLSISALQKLQTVMNSDLLKQLNRLDLGLNPKTILTLQMQQTELIRSMFPDAHIVNYALLPAMPPLKLIPASHYEIIVANLTGLEATQLAVLVHELKRVLTPSGVCVLALVQSQSGAAIKNLTLTLTELKNSLHESHMVVITHQRHHLWNSPRYHFDLDGQILVTMKTIDPELIIRGLHPSENADSSDVENEKTNDQPEDLGDVEMIEVGDEAEPEEESDETDLELEEIEEIEIEQAETEAEKSEAEIENVESLEEPEHENPELMEPSEKELETLEAFEAAEQDEVCELEASEVKDRETDTSEKERELNESEEQEESEETEEGEEEVEEESEVGNEEAEIDEEQAEQAEREDTEKNELAKTEIAEIHHGHEHVTGSHLAAHNEHSENHEHGLIHNLSSKKHQLHSALLSSQIDLEAHQKQCHKNVTSSSALMMTSLNVVQHQQAFLHHQALLTAYTHAFEKHKSLFKAFMASQSEINTLTPQKQDQYHALIKKHQAFIALHDTEIKEKFSSLRLKL